MVRINVRRHIEGEAPAVEKAVTATATGATGNTSEVSVRPVSSEDRERLGRMLSRISPRTIYERFHAPYRSVPGWALSGMVEADHHDREALVAVAGGEIVGHAM